MADKCRIVHVDGDPIRVRGDAPMTPEDVEMFAEVVRAAKEKFRKEYLGEWPPHELGPWRDKHGDVWTLGEDGLPHGPETRPFPRKLVERKWGPLVAEPSDSSTGEP